jgi:hypothetical protein
MWRHRMGRIRASNRTQTCRVPCCSQIAGFGSDGLSPVRVGASQAAIIDIHAADAHATLSRVRVHLPFDCG